METTKERLRELIIEELELALERENGGSKMHKALDLVTRRGWRTLGQKHPLFAIFSNADDQSLTRVLSLYGSTGLAEEEVNEITGTTTTGKGGWKAVFKYAKEGMELLDSLAGKFGDQDIPEELEQASQRFEFMLGAAKMAHVRAVAPHWSRSNPEEMEKLRRQHLVSQYENKESE